jgi:hypothetical protein
MCLLRGAKAPDHSTIARFRKEYLSDAVVGLFYQVVKHLHSIGEVRFENIFVDGTKIKANANKYTFVWKNVFNKNEAKMFLKIQSCLEAINLTYMTTFAVAKDTVPDEIRKALGYVIDKIHQENVEIVHGIGKRKSSLQKFKEELEAFFEWKQQYNDHNELFQGRNSYYKPDPYATFMHMKDDHMRNSHLKPGYNVQYVTGVGVFQDRNDIATLIPFLENMKTNLGSTYKNVIADSGYESD